MINFLANVADLTRAVLSELVAHIPGGTLQEFRPDLRCAVGGRPHSATDGLLCRWHFDELARWLRDIEAEAARLTPVPSMQTVYDSGGGTLASHRSPAVLDVLVYTDPRSTAHGHRHLGPVCASRHCAHYSCEWIRADTDEREANAERPLSVLGVLADLADRVRLECGIGQPVRTIVDRVPGHPGPICEQCTHGSCGDMRWTRHLPIPATVATERDVLTRQLRWIAAQPWVAQMRRDLSDLRTQLLRVNRNQDDRPLPGWCDWLVDGAECRGDLWPADTVHTSGYESAEGYRAVVCARNPRHRWEGVALARLSLIVAEQQRTEGNAS